MNMNKWKDTARTVREIRIKFAYGESVLRENTLLIVEKELANEKYYLYDSNPNKAERRQYKLKAEDIKIEDYAISRDINVQMLLADGWDAQDLLRKR